MDERAVSFPIVIVFSAVTLVSIATYACAAVSLGCRERFQLAVEEEENGRPRCACLVSGECLDADYVRQGGGDDGCHLYNNYRTCLKNAERNYDTVVLNNGELLRRARRGKRRHRGNRCLHHPSRSKFPGFACPNGTAPRNPTETDDGVLCD